MAAKIGVDMLRRMVADKSAVDVEQVGRILDAHDEVIKNLLAARSHIRFLNGWLLVKDTKPTRRRHPHTGEMLDLPAKEKVVYREVSKK